MQENERQVKGNMKKSKPIPIVVACLLSENEILLLKRNKEPFKDQWSLPGGKIDAGEFTDRAIRREIMEETGIVIQDLSYKGLVSELIYQGMDENNLLYHHLVHVFLSRVPKVNQPFSSEGELAWFGLDQVESLKDEMVISDYHIIKEMLLNDKPGLYNSLVAYTKQTYDCKKFVLITRL